MQQPEQDNSYKAEERREGIEGGEGRDGISKRKRMSIADNKEQIRSTHQKKKNGEIQRPMPKAQLKNKNFREKKTRRGRTNKGQ